MVQIHQGGRNAERGVLKPFGGSHLQVYRHLLIFLIIRLELSTQVLGNGRDRKVLLWVVIVQTQVYAHGDGVVITDIGGDESGRDTTCEILGKHIGEMARKRNVLCREFAHLDVVLIRLFHLAIVDVLSRHRP